MTFEGKFYTGEGIYDILGNLKVNEIIKICNENIAYITSHTQTQSKLYDMILEASEESQDKI